MFQTGGFSRLGFDKVLLRVAGEYKIIICSLIQDQNNEKNASWYWLNKKNIWLKKKTFTSGVNIENGRQGGDGNPKDCLDCLQDYFHPKFLKTCSYQVVRYNLDLLVLMFCKASNVIWFQEVVITPVVIAYTT